MYWWVISTSIVGLELHVLVGFSYVYRRSKISCFGGVLVNVLVGYRYMYCWAIGTCIAGI